MTMKKSHPSMVRSLKCILAALVLPLVLNAATVPTPKKTVAPKLESAQEALSGVISVTAEINKYGFVTGAEIAESSLSELDSAVLDAMRQWTFSPATENGEVVSSRVIQPFYFNEGSIVLERKKAVADKNPRVAKRISPELSGDLKNITGSVVLQASLDANGTVESVAVKSSTHSELESFASDALKQWSFKPAVKAGEAVASKIVVPFNFEGSGQEQTQRVVAKVKSVDRAPLAIRQPAPALPAGLNGERAEAVLEMVVDEFGYVASVDVVESSNEGLSKAAREAALSWKFKPALKDGVAVPSTVRQPFSFNGGLLTASLPVDSMPKVKRSKSPELPEALVGVQGFVSVRLDLDGQGKVLNASCTKSSHEELVAPSVEAAKQWSFKPAVREGEQVPSSVVVPFVFGG